MKNLAKLAVSHPWGVIAVTLGITVAMGGVIASGGIRFNGSLESLARDDSGSQFYNQVKGAFGDDRIIVVALSTDNVFTPEFISRLSKLTSDLEAVRGVEEAQSITNVKSIKRSGGGGKEGKMVPAGARDFGLRHAGGGGVQS